MHSHFLTLSILMGVSGQLYLEEDPPVCSEWEAGWVAGSFWTLAEEQQNLKLDSCCADRTHKMYLTCSYPQTFFFYQD